MNSFSNSPFSIKNIKTIPDYEKYVFSGTTFENEDKPIVIEYYTKQDSDGQKMWEINSIMNLNICF